MTLEQILAVPTAPSKEELARDLWDGDNCVSYSADGKRLLDAENFPSEITVKDGCEVICNEVFAFQDYMAGRRIGEDIPLEDRSSYLEKITLPNSVTHIGAAAFCECGELLKIKLPTGLLYIGPSAFADCWQLEKITLPTASPWKPLSFPTGRWTILCSSSPRNYTPYWKNYDRTKLQGSPRGRPPAIPL